MRACSAGKSASQRSLNRFKAATIARSSMCEPSAPCAAITRAATSGAPMMRRISAMTAPSTMAAASRIGPVLPLASRFRIRSIDV